MKEYWKLKDEALDHNPWRTRFGRGHGTAARQTTESMKHLNCIDFIESWEQYNLFLFCKLLYRKQCIQKGAVPLSINHNERYRIST
jgi:hypothetical protein